MAHTYIFPLEIKDVSDDGTFQGIASTYGNVDLGGDVIQPGAFTKSLERQDRIFLLADHDTTINARAGTAYLTDSKDGLLMRGELNLDKQVGRELYADIQHYKKHGVKLGLSIGYYTVKDEWKDGLRHLKEIDLREVSVVAFPMNPKAGVKKADPKAAPLAEQTPKSTYTFAAQHAAAPAPDAKAMSFDEAFAYMELWAERQNLTQALWTAIDDALYGYGSTEEERTDEAVTAQIDQDLTQHHAAVMDWVGRYLERRKAAPALETKLKADLESKVGRTLSKRTRARIDAALSALQALIDEVDRTDEDEDDKAAPHHETQTVPAHPDAEHTAATTTPAQEPATDPADADAPKGEALPDFSALFADMRGIWGSAT